MIEFNVLEIVGTYLKIDVQIANASYYDNVFIDTICFDTDDTFIESGPSSKARIIYSSENEEQKHIQLNVDIDMLQDKLFFIYVITKGEISPDAPCVDRHTMESAIVYDKSPLYVMAMKGINGIDCCDIPKDFIDFILRYKAFEISAEIGAYAKTVEYWKEFFGGRKRKLRPKCGCHG